MFENTSHAIRKKSSVYLTAQLEYLTSQIICQAFKITVNEGRSRISEASIIQGIENIPALKELFKLPSLTTVKESQKAKIKKSKKNGKKNLIVDQNIQLNENKEEISIDPDLLKNKKKENSNENFWINEVDIKNLSSSLSSFSSSTPSTTIIPTSNKQKKRKKKVHKLIDEDELDSDSSIEERTKKREKRQKYKKKNSTQD